MVSRARYRKVRDLYAEGLAVDIGDDLFVYLVPLNPFEQQDCRELAAVVRAKRMMALRDHDPDTMARVRAEFINLPIQDARAQLVERDLEQARIKVLQLLHVDEEWEEKLRIAAQLYEEGVQELPREHPDRKMLTELNVEYVKEIARRELEEREALEAEYEELDEELLEERWVSAFVANEGDAEFMARYALEELLVAARVCEATPVDDGELDHSACEGHELTLYADMDELKDERDPVRNLLLAKMRELNVSVAESKGSGSQASSSGSSRLPSEPEGSAPSSPEATPDEDPGSSPPPSATP